MVECKVLDCLIIVMFVTGCKMSSPFDPKVSRKNIDSKIVVALERISEAFRVVLSEENKKYNLSNIQIQILIFILFHNDELRTLTSLSEEFSISKASLSDSVKSLELKGYITKERNLKDFRSSTINLTEKGKEMAEKVASFGSKIESVISVLPSDKKGALLDSLLDVIHQLYLGGIISIKRVCVNCSYFVRDENNSEHFCTLLNKSLKQEELKIDCKELVCSS